MIGSVIAPPGTSTRNRPSADVNVVSVYVETVVGRHAPRKIGRARIAIARTTEPRERSPRRAVVAI
jgi:hypothetical protein